MSNGRRRPERTIKEEEDAVSWSEVETGPEGSGFHVSC